MRGFVLFCFCIFVCSCQWTDWIKNFGTDSFLYPDWIQQQINNCLCKPAEEGNLICYERENYDGEWKIVQPKGSVPLSYCVAKQWLIDHMPPFDKNFLPPSVSVRGSSMFDDNIAFALMADSAVSWSANIPLEVKLAYILPYATFHESRQNWRPFLFSKFFSLVASANSTVDAMKALAAPYFPQASSYTNWTGNQWPNYPKDLQDTHYYIHWRSSTSPPIIAPADFVSYGYGSCTAWSTLLTYVARSVGIPARQVGTPCWNIAPFAGLAKDNPNVTQCWHGNNGSTYGGLYLWNHNWVEYWDNVNSKWVFINVPPETADPDEGLCNTFSEQNGCDYDPVTGCSGANEGPALATRDHEIFSVTWHYPFEVSPYDGGDIIDVKNLQLSNGEYVSPLVWSPYLTNPLGQPLKDIGLRVVNRTDFYRCKPSPTVQVNL